MADIQFPTNPTVGQVYIFGPSSFRYNGVGWQVVGGGDAVSSVAGKTGVVTLNKTDIGLSSVDNTADADKPVSTAQAAAIALKMDKAGGTFTGDVSVPSINGGPLAGFRNRIINGAFAVNQRAVSGTVNLSAGAYGHDRWKAGSGGCTYTFTASGNETIITITAGSLLQVIEDKNVEGGTYAVSHAGTSQARVSVNGAATSGSYAAATQSAPLVSATANSGQTVSVEFSTGTVRRVMCEPGSKATPFERRAYGVELALCQRYAYRVSASGTAYAPIAPCQATSATAFQGLLPLPVTMRATPTVQFTNGGGGFNVWGPSGSTIVLTGLTANASPFGVSISGTVASGLTAGNSTFFVGDSTSGAALLVTSEL